MRVKTILDGQGQIDKTRYTVPSNITRKDLQIGLLAWYPDFTSETSYPEANYDITIIPFSGNEAIEGTRLREIFFNPLITKSKEWQTIDINNVKLINLDENINEFQLTADIISSSDSSTVKATQDPNELFEGWKYNFILVNKNELNNGKLEGIIEREAFDPANVTKDYCKQEVSTVSNNRRILGAVCPIDPIDQQEMSECLNWRRLDDLGDSCRTKNLLSASEIDDTVRNFCGVSLTRQDCRCVNRANAKDYIRDKPLHDGNDYCWYIPCASGFYLVEKQNQSVTCNSQSCNVIYQVGETGGSVAIDQNQTGQTCFNASNISKDTAIKYWETYPSNNFQTNSNTNNGNGNNFGTSSNLNLDMKYILAIGGAVILLLILFMIKRK